MRRHSTALSSFAVLLAAYSLALARAADAVPATITKVYVRTYHKGCGPNESCKDPRWSDYPMSRPLVATTYQSNSSAPAQASLKVRCGTSGPVELMCSATSGSGGKDSGSGKGPWNYCCTRTHTRDTVTPRSAGAACWKLSDGNAVWHEVELDTCVQQVLIEVNEVGSSDGNINGVGNGPVSVSPANTRAKDNVGMEVHHFHLRGTGADKEGLFTGDGPSDSGPLASSSPPSDATNATGDAGAGGGAEAVAVMFETPVTVGGGELDFCKGSTCGVEVAKRFCVESKGCVDVTSWHVKDSMGAPTPTLSDVARPHARTNSSSEEANLMAPHLTFQFITCSCVPYPYMFSPVRYWQPKVQPSLPSGKGGKSKAVAVPLDFCASAPASGSPPSPLSSSSPPRSPIPSSSSSSASPVFTGSGCGQPAADAFCRSKSLRQAVRFHSTEDEPTSDQPRTYAQTYDIGSGEVRAHDTTGKDYDSDFDKGMGFAYITCAR